MNCHRGPTAVQTAAGNCLCQACHMCHSVQKLSNLALSANAANNPAQPTGRQPMLYSAVNHTYSTSRHVPSATSHDTVRCKMVQHSTVQKLYRVDMQLVCNISAQQKTAHSAQVSAHETNSQKPTPETPENLTKNPCPHVYADDTGAVWGSQPKMDQATATYDQLQALGFLGRKPRITCTERTQLSATRKPGIPNATLPRCPFLSSRVTAHSGVPYTQQGQITHASDTTAGPKKASIQGTGRHRVQCGCHAPLVTLCATWKFINDKPLYAGCWLLYRPFMLADCSHTAAHHPVPTTQGPQV